MTSLLPEPDTKPAEAFAGRVFDSVLGLIDSWSIYIGDKLGLYDAPTQEPLTRDELVSRTQTQWRYIGEWLEQQVTTGFLEVDDASADSADRIYSLPQAHREVLVDRDSLNYLTPFVRLVTAGGLQLPAILEAYRGGGGVPWERYGDDMRTGQGATNRPWSTTHWQRIGFRMLPRSTIGCHGPTPGWPTSGAARVGRRSPWPRRIRA